MADFVNTVDVIGEDALVNSFIDRTIAEYRDDKCTGLGKYAFYHCKKLKVVDVPNATYIHTGNFDDCLIESLKFPNVTTAAGYCYNGCRWLKSLDFGKLTSIPSYMISYTPALVALILRNTSSICTLANTNNITNAPKIVSGTGYIYVPRALIEAYKVATNWSTYAAQFRALEDYTVDGTVTGELDETKI